MRLFLVLKFFLFSLLSFSQNSTYLTKSEFDKDLNTIKKYEHENIYSILSNTKSIAILPATTSIFTFFGNKIKSESFKLINEDLNQGSANLQNDLYGLLNNSKLSVVLQDPKETNRILFEKKILDINSLSILTKNILCSILDVDAVLFIDVNGGVFTNISNQSNIRLLSVRYRLYEKVYGSLVWVNSKGDDLNRKERIQNVLSAIIVSSFKKIPFIIN